MNIFITGISGVLGSTLAKELRHRGHHVNGCDLAHSSDPNVFRADVAEQRQLSRAFNWCDGVSAYNPTGRGIDLVYHFAAEFGRNNGQLYYEDLWRSNCIGTRNVIEECVLRAIPMVFSSSSEAYGLSELYNEDQPLREEMLDSNPPQFHNEYALSKYTNERQIFTASRNNGLQAIVLRFFNVYGPPERFSPFRSVACQFAWKMLHGERIVVNKEGKRSHLWIGDWANTVANISDDRTINNLLATPEKVWLGAGGTPGVPVFNIGGTEYETIERLYILIKEVIKEIPGIPESTVQYINSEIGNSATKQPNNSLARVYLAHNPVMPLESGLKKMVYELLRIKENA